MPFDHPTFGRVLGLVGCSAHIWYIGLSKDKEHTKIPYFSLSLGRGEPKYCKCSTLFRRLSSYKMAYLRPRIQLSINPHLLTLNTYIFGRGAKSYFKVQSLSKLNTFYLSLVIIGVTFTGGHGGTQYYGSHSPLLRSSPPPSSPS